MGAKQETKAQDGLLPPERPRPEAVVPERVIWLCDCKFDGPIPWSPRRPSGLCEIHGFN